MSKVLAGLKVLAAIAMLFLLFQIGSDRYALDAGQVIEVLPMLHWKTIPQAPPGVAGAFNYHGAPVPLIDLAAMALGKPSPPRMSTRIILVKYSSGENGETFLLGLLAENATTTLRCAESEFVESGVAVDSAPYLGPVKTDADGIIQRVEISRLLSEEVRDLLFRRPLEIVT